MNLPEEVWFLYSVFGWVGRTGIEVGKTRGILDLGGPIIDVGSGSRHNRVPRLRGRDVGLDDDRMCLFGRATALVPSGKSWRS